MRGHYLISIIRPHNFKRNFVVTFRILVPLPLPISSGRGEAVSVGRKADCEPRGGEQGVARGLPLATVGGKRGVDRPTLGRLRARAQRSLIPPYAATVARGREPPRVAPGEPETAWGGWIYGHQCRSNFKLRPGPALVRNLGSAEGPHRCADI